MKTLAFFLWLFILIGCSELRDDPEPTKETHYNFNVSTADNTRFVARITWQCGTDAYVDPMDSWLYGSSFKIAPGEQFTITVKSPATNLKLDIFPNEKENHLPRKTVYIQSDVTYTFDDKLNN